VGYFIESDAEKKIKTYRRDVFIDYELPQLFKNMFLLGLSFKDLESKYKKYIDKNFKSALNEME
jgi:hypothetical protein